MTTGQWEVLYRAGINDAADGTKDYHFYSQCPAYRRGWDYENHLQAIRREVQYDDLAFAG